MITLAFYKAPGTWQDALIRRFTRAPYSHVELLIDRPQGATPITARAVSSSIRDGGVRVKAITFDPSKWQFVDLPWADDQACWKAVQRVGAPYDLMGILFSQVLAARLQSADRWFCSELCAWALDLATPETLSPAGLFDRVTEMNRAYDLGRLAPATA